MLKQTKFIGSFLLFLSPFIGVGCVDDFDPQSELSGLEVLAIQASPPTIEFGESTTLRALIHTDGEEANHVWSVCLFDLGPPLGFECVSPALECCLGDTPEVVLSTDVLTTCSQDCLDVAPNTVTEEDAKLLALSESPEGMMVLLGELESVRVRLHVSTPSENIEAVKTVNLHKDGVKNTNPVFTELTYEGDKCQEENPCLWEEGTLLDLYPGETLTLKVTVAPGGEGAEEEEQLENSTVAWFIKGAEVNEFFSVAVEGENQLKIPALDEGETSRDVSLWLVARDGVGGSAWTQRNVTVVENPDKVGE